MTVGHLLVEAVTVADNLGQFETVFATMHQNELNLASGYQERIHPSHVLIGREAFEPHGADFRLNADLHRIPYFAVP